MYTGNTGLVAELALSFAVYPCVYREHICNFIKTQFYVGLSLCIQGTHLCKYYPHKNVRFIPVYTGNTLCPCKSFAGLAVYPCVYREHFRLNYMV